VALRSEKTLLVARLPLHQQAVAFRVPLDARQVVVLPAEVAPGDGAGVEREDRERDVGIRPPRGGIALLQHPHAFGADFEALDLVDRGFVDAGKGDVALVGRPPVPGVAAHLLLRDELGDAVAHEPAAAGRESALRARRQLHGMQVLVADEADVAAARRELRIGLEGSALGEPAHGPGGGLRQVVVVEIAAERHQQALRVRGPLVVDDAAQGRDALALAPRFLFGGQRLVRRRQRARIHQQPVVPARNVVGPEVEDRRRVVAGAQVGDEPAIGREAHLPQRRPLQVRRIEQPLDRQVARMRLGEEQRRGKAENS
jgi:hypothetical protein